MSLIAILAAIVAYLFIGYWWAKKKMWRRPIWFADRILNSAIKVSNGERLGLTAKYTSYQQYYQNNDPLMKGINFWFWLPALCLVSLYNILAIILIILCFIYIFLPYWLIVWPLFIWVGKLINGEPKVASS